jgi:hypothetical protein
VKFLEKELNTDNSVLLTEKNNFETKNRDKKRIFISLLLSASFLVISFFIFLGYISYKGIGSFSSIAGIILSLIVLSFVAFILITTFILVIAMISGKSTPVSNKIRGTLTKSFFPIVVWMGKFFKIDKDTIIRSFIRINNELVLNSINKVKNILILLPHCIQLEDCELKITTNINTCKMCGRCDIKGLINIADKYGLNINVATGGTIARRIVKEKRPELILAVACERDLLSGIQDTHPLPVVGVLNERPFGPCINTKVSLTLIDSLIKKILKNN